MYFHDERKLRSHEAAEYLRVSTSTLAKWRMRNEGPPFERCGPRLVLYDREVLKTWLAEKRSQTRAAASADRQRS
jgi:excisionase family DNA binding protein